MSSYNAVAEYLSALIRVAGKSGAVILDSKRMVAILSIGSYYLVLQAHDSRAWDLLKDVAKEPEKLKAFLDAISKASETVIPAGITVMRVRKEDVNNSKRNLK